MDMQSINKELNQSIDDLKMKVDSLNKSISNIQKRHKVMMIILYVLVVIVVIIGFALVKTIWQMISQ